MSVVKSVVVMAGGTGGHVFPALAVARRLQELGVSVAWLGTAKGIEARVVPAAGIPLRHLDVGGLRGNGLKPLLQAPFKLLRAVWQARAYLREHRADAVIGLGGYVTGPGGVAARLLGLPLVIHEQNAVAGLTNRLLARLADTVLLGFPGALPTGEQVIWVGNPVREDILTLAAPASRYAGRRGPLRILVVGGSLGAQALNQLLPAAVAQLPATQRPQIRHQTGQQQLAATQERYALCDVAAEVTAFIDDMAAAYDWADLVVCRSGALTVAELAVAGVASLLVPYPHAVDDHQTANARFLSDAGAAVLCPQATLTPDRLAEQLQALSDRDRLLVMAEAARVLAKADATELVVNTLLRGQP